tara:strand:+ start:2976 stop:4409 length:1434 start_codon:yes stop_codon:yes gene_type:complete
LFVRFHALEAVSFVMRWPRRGRRGASMSGCTPEGLNPDKKVKYRTDELSLKDYFLGVQEAEQTPNGVFGIKLMLADLAKLPSLTAKGEIDPYKALKEVFPQPYFIRIHRRNRLQQAVSFAKALQSNKWSNTQKNRRLDADTLFFSYSSIFKYLQTIEAEEAAWAAFFEENKIPSFEVCYEEFISDYVGTVEKVLDHCGIELDGEVDPSKNIHTKMADSINASWSSQFETLQNGLKDGGKRAAVEDSKIDAAIELLNLPLSVGANTKVCCKARLHSDGPEGLEPFGKLDASDWLVLKYGWSDGSGVDVTDPALQEYGLNAIPLEEPVDPNSSIEAGIVISTPKAPGDYRLRVYLARGSNGGLLGTVTEAKVEAWAGEVGAKAAEYFGVSGQLEGAMSGWFGRADVSEFPKITHSGLGVVWCSGPGASEDSYFFNAPSFGWIWTNSKQYPLFKLMDEERWIRLPELVDELKESRLKAQK